jgi:putative transposase
MGRAFRQLYYHVVWTTKNREPVLHERVRPLLLEVLCEKCRMLHCQVHALNAVEDHVHVALEIPPSRAVSDAVGRIKGAASHALNQTQPDSMYWQDGYGAVTFRKGELAKVCEYVATQQGRHRLGRLSKVLETCEDADEEP